MTKKLNASRDTNSDQLPVVKLSVPQEIDGSAPASVQSAAFNTTMIRIYAVSGTVRLVIGTNPVASATSIALGEGGEMYQPIKVGEKIAIYGGVANVSECGD